MGPEKCPHLKPFSRVCTIVPYPSSANKGMYHRYGVWHESPLSPHVPRFTGSLSTTGTSAAAWCVLSQHRPQHPDSALRALLLACGVQAGSAASALQGIEEGH
jgi:hypothetical protein